MKWDNCLVSAVAAGLPAPSTLRIVDWELADFGDGLWDAGAVFHSFLCAWLMSMPPHDEARAESLVGAARHPIDAMQPAMRAFWQGYLDGRGIATADSGAALLRCTQYAAARMIQTAYEALSYAPSVTPSTLRLLQVSLNILTRPRDALRDLLCLVVAAGPRATGGLP
jgi:hypothetical protein